MKPFVISLKGIPRVTQEMWDRINAKARQKPQRKTQMTTLKPFRNNVMFRFLDETSGSKGKFTDRKTPSGIIIPTLDSTQKKARWGEVLAVGPDAQVSVGEFIYIEGLQWTFGTEIDGQKMWKTDDTRILFATDDLDTVYAIDTAA